MYLLRQIQNRIRQSTTKKYQSKDATKPISNNIDLSDRETFDSIKSLFTDNGAFRVNTVNPTKARVESDKVLLKSFTDILRQFELIEKAVLDAGIIEKIFKKLYNSCIKK